MKKLFIYLIRGYQRFISPGLAPRCRYYPTCSHYTLEAIERHGALKGGLMGAARILRCHPFAKGGFDYVPTRFTFKKQPNPPQTDTCDCEEHQVSSTIAKKQ